MILPGDMGALGSHDPMGLLKWIFGSRSVKLDIRKGDFAGGWNAMAASKCGIGLLAAGAQLQLRQFLCRSSQHSELNKRAKKSIGNGNGRQSSELHWRDLLSIVPLTNCGGIGSPCRVGLSVLISSPWSSWYLGPKVQNDSSRGKVILASLGSGAGGGSPVSADEKNHSQRRNITSFLLGLNLLVFLGQAATQGRLLLLGAKVNSLIAKGQLWRLITPAVLHANVIHLLVNSYSLNSIGPSVEALAGPGRFLAVYSVSALTSTSLSYFLCSAPSVGASGAIFGLVGALAVFLVRHKNMMIGGQRSLQQVGRVIAINMMFGLMSEGIDNWSHFGGLVGGAAVTWLLGPVYSFESPPGGGKRQLVDRPPISYLLPAETKKKR